MKLTKTTTCALFAGSILWAISVVPVSAQAVGGTVTGDTGAAPASPGAPDLGAPSGDAAATGEADPNALGAPSDTLEEGSAAARTRGGAKSDDMGASGSARGSASDDAASGQGSIGSDALEGSAGGQASGEDASGGVTAQGETDVE